MRMNEYSVEMCTGKMYMVSAFNKEQATILAQAKAINDAEEYRVLSVVKMS